MMYEDVNEVPVPDMTVLRDVRITIHCDTAKTASEVFGEVGSLDPSTSEEPIDDDPTINALLAARDL